ncbi:hypothetical protein DESA109040_17080 [Deinococcus saxicola]|uniref:ATP-binding cassette domain-containing protein n=1 Tax=Deinococcus saxicola TaxID=249406 RepID=UPI0039F13993
MNAIETTAPSKPYAPGVGLAPLNLSVQADEIFGFIGPNGAGKTTAIRTLMGFLRPSGGSGRILGHDVWQERVEVHRRVGYLPRKVHLARDHTARELMGHSCRLRCGASDAYGLDVARRLELRLDARLGTLSKGNRQKMGLTLALRGCLRRSGGGFSGLLWCIALISWHSRLPSLYSFKHTVFLTANLQKFSCSTRIFLKSSLL